MEAVTPTSTSKEQTSIKSKEQTSSVISLQTEASHSSMSDGSVQILHCDHCHFVTASKANLRKHFTRMHRNVSFKCNMCNSEPFKTRSRSNLKTHLKQVHSMEDSAAFKWAKRAKTSREDDATESRIVETSVSCSISSYVTVGQEIDVRVYIQSLIH